jgi:glycosyltransferase involved in cell wall biosynthesis
MRDEQGREDVMQETAAGATAASALDLIRSAAPRRTTPQLSVVMPVYNEEDCIAGVARELADQLFDRLGEVELVLVDDASSDATPEILDRLAASDPRFRVHHAPENRGHGPALRRAIDESRGDWIFQIDADGQQLAGEFWKLWERRHVAGLVMGKRQILRNGRHRVFVSASARYVSRALGGGDIRDVNVPFKLFRRSVWEDLRDDIPEAPIVPSLLIALGASLQGWSVVQVPVTSLPRRHGPSKVNVPRLVRLSAGALREVAAFRLRMARRRRT